MGPRWITGQQTDKNVYGKRIKPQLEQVTVLIRTDTELADKAQFLFAYLL